jgi:hypothetical protein
MSVVNDSRARAVADLTEGLILASVEVAGVPNGDFTPSSCCCSTEAQSRR